MDRRTYIGGIGSAVATGALAGCTGNGSDGGNGTGDGNGNGNDDTDDQDGGTGDTTEYGVLSTSVTDQPNDIGDFESLIVTIRGIWVKPAGGDEESDDTEDDEDAEDADAVNETDDVSGAEDVNGTETEDANGTDDDDSADSEDSDGEETESDEDDAADEGSGRYYIEFEEPQDADLVQLQGDNTQLVDETELEVGEYQFLQLDIEDTSGTLTDGEEAAVETPGNAPLQFKQAFEIRSEERTRFIADFAPFKRGNGSYLIRPVASGTRVIYGDEERDSEESDEADNETDGDDADAGGDDGDGDSDDGGSGNGGGGSYDVAGVEN